MPCCFSGKSSARIGTSTGALEKSHRQCPSASTAGPPSTLACAGPHHFSAIRVLTMTFCRSGCTPVRAYNGTLKTSTLAGRGQFPQQEKKISFCHLALTVSIALPLLPNTNSFNNNNNNTDHEQRPHHT
uniref:Uncharacterized protein n=1 Tax=Physcomitrium patens TaxID=3218 RepID=A0A2K1JVK8_PHYPA|nr:hypothetical protein PHYPA_015332 [Physcomitrium patens]